MKNKKTVRNHNRKTLSDVTKRVSEIVEAEKKLAGETADVASSENETSVENAAVTDTEQTSENISELPVEENKEGISPEEMPSFLKEDFVPHNDPKEFEDDLLMDPSDKKESSDADILADSEDDIFVSSDHTEPDENDIFASTDTTEPDENDIFASPTETKKENILDESEQISEDDIFATKDKKSDTDEGNIFVAPDWVHESDDDMDGLGEDDILAIKEIKNELDENDFVLKEDEAESEFIEEPALKTYNEDENEIFETENTEEESSEKDEKETIDESDILMDTAPAEEKKETVGPPKAHSFTQMNPEVSSEKVYSIVTPSILDRGNSEEGRVTRKRVVIQTTPPNEGKSSENRKKIKAFLKKYILFPAAGISGLIVLTLIGVYFYIPTLLNGFMKENYPLVRYHLDRYSLSQMVFSDVGDKNNKLQIKKVIVKYDLQSLLNKKIDEIELHNMSLPIEGIDQYSLQLGVLADFIGKSMKPNGLSIKKIAIKSSKGIISVDKESLPISFEAKGDLRNKPNFMVPFNIKQKNFEISDGKLKVTVSPKKTDLDFTIREGFVDLFGEKRALDGTTKIELNDKAVIQSIKTEGKLADLDVKASFVISGENTYDFEGNISGSYLDRSFFNTDIPFNFTASLKNIVLSDHFEKATSNSTLMISASNLGMEQVFSKQIQFLLNGTLLCQKGHNCTYRLNPKYQSKARLGETYFLKKRSLIQTLGELNAVFKTSPHPLIETDGKTLAIKALLDNFQFKGQIIKGGNQIPLDTLFKNLLISYKSGENGEMTLNSSDTDVITSDFSVSKARFSWNLKDKNSSFMLVSPQAEFSNKKFFDEPFALSLSSDEKDAVVFAVNTPRLQIQGNGTFQNSGNTAVMDFQTTPINFSPTLQPAQISPMFASLTEGVAGTLQAKGRFVSSLETIVPYVIQLSTDTGLTLPIGNWTFKNARGTVDVKSIDPLVSLPNQHVEIEQIIYPPFRFDDVDMTYEIDGAKDLLKINEINFSIKGLKSTLKNEKISFLFAGAPIVTRFYHIEDMLTRELGKYKIAFLGREVMAEIALKAQGNRLHLERLTISSATEMSVGLNALKPTWMSSLDYNQLKSRKFKKLEIRGLVGENNFLLVFPQDGVQNEITFRLPNKLLNTFFE